MDLIRVKVCDHAYRTFSYANSGGQPSGSVAVTTDRVYHSLVRIFDASISAGATHIRGEDMDTEELFYSYG